MYVKKLRSIESDVIIIERDVKLIVIDSTIGLLNIELKQKICIEKNFGLINC